MLKTAHTIGLGDAMRTAEELIVDLKKGDITWEEAAREHSACASGSDKAVIPLE